MDVFEVERDLISLFLVRYGEWADLEAQFISEVISDDIAVADIGAYLGTFGLGLGERRRLSRIHFVEANSVVIPLLRSNAERNCNTTWVVEPALVAPEGAKNSPGFSEPGNIGNTSFDASCSERTLQSVPVPAKITTLENLRRMHGDFGLIKLDVEGMELAILESDVDYIKVAKSTIWCECNEQPSSLSLVKFLLACKLAVYYFAFPSFNPDNFNRDSIPIFPFAFEAGLLAMPEDRKLTFDARARGCILVRIESVEDLKRALWKTPRWAPREWLGETFEAIIAQASRYIIGQTYESFLDGSGDAGSLSAQNRSQTNLVQTRLRLAEAEERGLIYSMMIGEGKQALRRVEEELSDALVMLREGQNRLTESDAHLLEALRDMERMGREVDESRSEIVRLSQRVRDQDEALRAAEIAESRHLVFRAQQDALLKLSRAKLTEETFLMEAFRGALTQNALSLATVNRNNVVIQNRLEEEIEHLKRAKLWTERLAEHRLKILVSESDKRDLIYRRIMRWVQRLNDVC